MADKTDTKEKSNKSQTEKEKEEKLNESRQNAKEKLEQINNNLDKKKKSGFFNTEGFVDFVKETLNGIVFLVIYFYFGVNFSLLSKSTKLNPGGLKGQNLDEAPYIGDFAECKEPDIDISQPLSKWSFPYKNSIICNKEYNLTRPLSFRFITWSVSVLAFSYSIGRKALNKFFTLSDENSIILFGPLITAFIILCTPFVSGLSSYAGIFMNYEKMLPHDYTTFWFPVTSFLLFLWGFFSYPTLIVIMQLLTVIYFLLFHISFNKVDILEDGEKKTTTGVLSILKRVFKNKLFFLFILVTAAQSAYNNLGLFFALPIIGWLLFYAYTTYISSIIESVG